MKVFLSCASTEFRSYRLKLANQLGALKGRPYEVKVQEDFQQGGFTLLDQLADYVRSCDLVIHLVGDACGARPTPEHVRTMFTHLGVPAPQPLPERSYTQWEYDLAQRFQRSTFCYFATPETPRDCALPVAQSEQDAQLQREHRQRIEDSGKHRATFAGHTDLARRVFFDLGIGPDKKINNLPFKSIGSLFKGREEFLAQLRKTLSGGEHRDNLKIAAITATPTAATLHGLGGIGKTRAAIEYAHKYADEYTALLFVQADTPEGLQQNIASLCGSLVLDLAEKSAKETEVQVAAVLQWLKQHPGWFLILDNVDTEEAAMAVQKLLARLSLAGQVVITSRIGNWEAGVDTLALDVLSADASTEFLLERTERGRTQQDDDPARARELAIELGQLALALEQAGAYIILYGSTFAGYLEEWKKNHERVMEWFHERTMQYPSSVAVTWQTSFDRLSVAARELLRLLGWLAPDPVPESLLDAGGGPFAGGPARSDPHAALADLFQHSLAAHVEGDASFSVHRLVQDVTRFRIPESERPASVARALSWVNLAFIDQTQVVAFWPVLAPLAPHARAVVRFADEQHAPADIANLMDRLGRFLMAKAQFREAEPLLRRALALEESAPTPPTTGPSRLGRFYNNLGALLNDTNRHQEAGPMLRRAVALEEAAPGGGGTSLAIRLTTWANWLVEDGQPQEAEQALRRALAIEEKVYGPVHPNVAICLNSLSSVLNLQGRPKEAEKLLRRSIAVCEQTGHGDDPLVSVALSNLGKALQQLGRSAEAQRCLRRALAIDERAYGPDHPTVATRLNDLAGLAPAGGPLTEEEEQLRRSLAIDEAAYGPDNPKVATALSNLAWVLAQTGREGEAEVLCRRALAIDERSYDPLHPNIATSLNSLGAVLAMTGRDEEAEPLLARACVILDVATLRSKREHPDIRRAFANYEALLQHMGVQEPELGQKIEAIFLQAKAQAS